MPSGPVMTMVAVFVGGGGGGSFLGHSYLLEVLSSLVPVQRILHSKWVLTKQCSSTSKVMVSFRRVP
jgi:hypothetical protein